MTPSQHPKTDAFFELIKGPELDEEYFDSACELITNATRQTTLDFSSLNA